MNRKEWLEKFIGLVDSGAPTLDFRRYCRVKAQHLPRHMRKLDEFRSELLALQATEDLEKRQEEIRQSRLKALEEARRVKVEQATKRREELERQALPNDADSESPADGLKSWNIDFE